jgi:hypothetical protein
MNELLVEIFFYHSAICGVLNLGATLGVPTRPVKLQELPQFLRFRGRVFQTIRTMHCGPVHWLILY